MSGPPEVPSPALFEDVVGQERAIETLRGAARHPVHAYLFVGTPGAGPRAAARGFAAALLCPEGGCGACDVCRRVLDGVHPDLVVVEHAGPTFDVDDARRVSALSERRPFEAPRQVLVVEDVHLGSQAVPALLKTIEEPASETVFVLLASHVPADMATLASRCVEVTFPPVPGGTIERWLVARGVEPSDAALAAETSDGDPERARRLAEDPGFAERLQKWRAIPGRLDGDGATVAGLVADLLSAADDALGPLQARHAAALADRERGAKAAGARTDPGRRELVDQQRREERRWRSAELRLGLGVLSRTYRDGLLGGDEGASRAIALIGETARALDGSAREVLALEHLFVCLGKGRD